MNALSGYVLLSKLWNIHSSVGLGAAPASLQKPPIRIPFQAEIIFSTLFRNSIAT